MSFQSFINISLMIRLITSVPVVAVALQPSLAVITIDVRPRSGRKTAVIVGPSFNHPPWQLSCACARPVKGPSQKWYGIVCACVVCGMVCVGFRVLSLSLSLSLSRGRQSTFGVMPGFWAKFKEITKGKWSHHQSLGFSKV